MHLRRLRVGYLLHELLLWGVIVGLAGNHLVTAGFASASGFASARAHGDQACLTATVHDSPALCADLTEQQSFVLEKSHKVKLLGLCDAKGAAGSNSAEQSASMVSMAGINCRTSLVMLGVRLQI